MEWLVHHQARISIDDLNQHLFRLTIFNSFYGFPYVDDRDRYRRIFLSLVSCFEWCPWKPWWAALHAYRLSVSQNFKPSPEAKPHLAAITSTFLTSVGLRRDIIGSSSE